MKRIERIFKNLRFLVFIFSQESSISLNFLNEGFSNFTRHLKGLKSQSGSEFISYRYLRLVAPLFSFSKASRRSSAVENSLRMFDIFIPFHIFNQLIVKVIT